jgi:hypothetical protein
MNFDEEQDHYMSKSDFVLMCDEIKSSQAEVQRLTKANFAKDAQIKMLRDAIESPLIDSSISDYFKQLHEAYDAADNPSNLLAIDRLTQRAEALEEASEWFKAQDHRSICKYHNSYAQLELRRMASDLLAQIAKLKGE